MYPKPLQNCHISGINQEEQTLTLSMVATDTRWYFLISILCTEYSERHRHTTELLLAWQPTSACGGWTRAQLKPSRWRHTPWSPLSRCEYSTIENVNSIHFDHKKPGRRLPFQPWTVSFKICLSPLSSKEDGTGVMAEYISEGESGFWKY